LLLCSTFYIHLEVLHTHTHTRTHARARARTCVCVCVCVHVYFYFIYMCVNTCQSVQVLKDLFIHLQSKVKHFLVLFCVVAVISLC
jgi:hypothetical protein